MLEHRTGLVTQSPSRVCTWQTILLSSDSGHILSAYPFVSHMTLSYLNGKGSFPFLSTLSTEILPSHLPIQFRIQALGKNGFLQHDITPQSPQNFWDVNDDPLSLCALFLSSITLDSLTGRWFCLCPLRQSSLVCLPALWHVVSSLGGPFLSSFWNLLHHIISIVWLMLFSRLAFSLFSNYVNSFFHHLSAWPCIGWLLSALIGCAMVSEASWSDASIAKVFDYIWVHGVPYGHQDAYLSITRTETKQMRDRH